MNALAPSVANGPTRLRGEPGDELRIVPTDRRDVEGVVDGNAVIYENAHEDCDVVTVLSAEGVEEFLIWRSKRARDTIAYELEPPTGGRTETREGGDIVVLDGKGRHFARLTPSLARDAAGDHVPVERHLAFNAAAGTWHLEIDIDPSGKTYPITIDPNWQFGPGFPDAAVVAHDTVDIADSYGIYGDVVAISSTGLITLSGQEVTIFGDVIADNVTIDPGPTVTGDAHVNSLVGPGVLGSVQPVAVPVDLTVPSVPPFQHNQNDLVITGPPYGLDAGVYGDVIIDRENQEDPVEFSDGVFTLKSLTITAGDALECTGVCEVRITERLHLEAGASLTQYQEDSSKMWIFVLGSDDAVTGEPAVLLEDGSTLIGEVFAPNGSVSLDSYSSDSELVGRVVAKDFAMGGGGSINGQQWAGEPDCASYCAALTSIPECGSQTQQQCEAECNAEVVDRFCSFQNRWFVDCVNESEGQLYCDNGEPTREHCEKLGILFKPECASACASADDGDACTIDYCECTPYECPGPLPSQPVDTPMFCTAGACAADADLCTNDVCDPILGAYPPKADDGDPTTFDWCDPATGDVYNNPLTASGDPSDTTVATDIASSTAFLYTGTDPIQTGVAAQTIDKTRAAVVRGHVRDATGPVAGVTVSIVDHPELGSTMTMGDGTFSMAVNGGSWLTVAFDHPSYLSAQRAVYTGWNEYAFTEDVFLRAPNPNATTVAFNAPGWTVVEGALEQDERGARTARLLVPPGTLHDNTSGDFPQTLTSMTVRITEYTVGDDGVDAMPATLPPATAYTYAVELSADEAPASQYDTIAFTKDVILYTENYLGFAVGKHVPLGYYDRGRGQWVAEENGLVLEIVGITNGQADLDLDGVAGDDPNHYALFGITSGERQQLASLYSVGDELWRVRMDHFTPADVNPAFKREGECAWMDDTCTGEPPEAMQPEDCASEVDGSIIECQNQTVGQRIPVKGTPYALHYKSGRTPGYEAARRLRIPVTGTTIPAGVYKVLVDIQIAGQRHKQVVLTKPLLGGWSTNEQNHVFVYDWDGKDAWGREVLGPQTAIVRVGYTFRRNWLTDLIDTIQLGSSFGSWPTSATFSVELSADDGIEYAVWTGFRVGVGGWDHRPLGLGGFGVDVHHAYSPASRTLFLGNGRRISDAGRGAMIELWEDGYQGDNYGMAVSPDGALYVAVHGNDEGVLRIDQDQTVTWLTSTAPGSCGITEGGLVSTAKICRPRDLDFGPDGSLYIVEHQLGSTPFTKIYKVTFDPAGDTIETFAGNGTVAGGSDGVAVQQPLREPRRVAAAPDGSVYFVDRDAAGEVVIRRVDTAGIMRRVAGAGNDVPPTEAHKLDLGTLTTNIDIDVGHDGSLYVTRDEQVFRIWPDGQVNRVAGSADTSGNGIAGVAGDGGRATMATLWKPNSIEVAPDGGLFIAVNDVSVGGGANGGIRYVSPEGIIHTLVGSDNPACDGSQATLEDCGIPGPAASAELYNTSSLRAALAPNGDLFVRQSADVFRVRRAMPGVATSDIYVPSPDGRLVYTFDSRGQHQTTRDALTGTTLHAFGYTDGRLTSVTDVDGRQTTIAHTFDGDDIDTVTLTGPDGHQTVLQSPDALGFMTTIDMPAVTGNVTLAYNDGLLTLFAGPNGKQKTYTYTDGTETHGFAGLLESAVTSDPGGTREFQRSAITDGFAVAFERAHQPAPPEANVTTYEVVTSSDGAKEHRTKRLVDGGTVETTSALGIDGVLTTSFEDGTTITVTTQPDDRFEMQAPIPAKTVVSTGTKSVTILAEQTVTPNPSDFIQADAWSRTVCVNGTISGASCVNEDAGGTLSYATAGVAGPEGDTLTLTTAEGRTITTTLNGNGKPASQAIASATLDVASVSWTYYDGTNVYEEGKLHTVELTSLAGTRTYTFSYDPADGMLSKITDPASREVDLDVDGGGRVTQLTLPDDEVVLFGYDDSDNLTSLDPPRTNNTHGFEVNGVSLVDKYLPPAVSGVTDTEELMTFNGDRQLELVELNKPSNTSTINPTYDDWGRLDDVVFDAYNRPAWTLDVAYVTSGVHLGKLSSIDNQRDGVVVATSYDGALLSKMTWSGTGITSAAPTQHEVTFGYDGALRVNSETVGTQTAVTSVYDDDGLITTAGDLVIARDPTTGIVTGTTLSPGTEAIADTIDLTPFGELDDYTLTWDADGMAGGEDTLYDVDYERDSLGRVHSKSETVDGTTEHYGYQYDTAGRLWKVYYSATSACGPAPGFGSCAEVAAYTYDANGNRSGCTYDAQDRMTSCGATPSLTSYDYTDWGALASKVSPSMATTTYEYDLLGNLTKVTMPSTDTYDYHVDGWGRRVAKFVNGSSTPERQWIYRDALNPLAELDGAGNVTAIFVYGVKPHVPEYMEKGGNTYRLVTDHLGSVRLVVRVSDGAIAQKWDYDASGVASFDASAVTVVGADEYFQPFGYAGGLYDPDTGLVRFGARDYDPEVGRWTTKDPILFNGGINLYEYSRGDPINYIDVTGEDPILIGLVVGGAIGGVWYAATTDIGSASVGGYLGWWSAGALAGATGAWLGGGGLAAAAQAATAGGGALAGLMKGCGSRGGNASTPFGQSVQGVRQAIGGGGGPWQMFTSHAEQATSASKRLQGATSIEQVFVHAGTGERVIRHIIVRDGAILHETFRPYAKFGAQ